MLKVMIVDDERHVREGLYDLMPWGELGLTVCAMADDGVAAVERMAEAQPDIVITDVRMLQMDGITLGRAIRESHPDVKLIFISGYGDSAYLKAALRLEAVDYVFKPINLAEMTEVLRRVVSAIEMDRKNSARMEHMAALLEESLPLLREQFLRDWIGGAFESVAEWEAALDFLRMEKSEAFAPIVLVADTEDHRPVSGVMLKELLKDRMPEALICPNRRELVVLWRQNGGENDALASLFECRKELSEAYGIELTVCVGAPTSDPMRVPDAVRAAADMLKKRFFAGARSIFFLDVCGEEGVEDAPPAVPSVNLTKLEQRLLSSDGQGVAELIDHFFAQLGAGKPDIRQVRGQCMLIALTCALALEKRGVEADALALCASMLEDISMAQMRAALMRYLKDAVGRAAASSSGPAHLAIREVCAYIHEHLGEHITLETLARRANYAPTYLSMLFKQETGSTVWDYLLTCRMEEAMRRLRETKENVYQIALAVGYADQAHFTRLFKRVCGVTPMAYRKQAAR